jgi:translation initiation factor IF-1
MSKKSPKQKKISASNQPINTKEPPIIVEGKIVELLPAGTFKILLDESGKEIISHLSGNMRRNKIRLALGDRVKVEMSRSIRL